MTRFSPDPLIHPVFHQAFASDPFVTYDIGAAGELFSIVPLSLGGYTKVVAFEPAPASFAALEKRYGRDGNVSLNRLALAETPGTMTFNLNRSGPTVSSLQSRASVHAGDWEAIDVDTSTLDQCSSDGGLPSPDFIKADVEGAELRIFEGGAGTLRSSAMGIYTEFEFWQPPEQGPRFSDVDRFLTDRGFVLFDMNASRGSSAVGGKKNRLNKGNALYLRDFYDFLESNRSMERHGLRRRLLGLAASACSYLYFEYPIELLDLGIKEGLLEEDEGRSAIRHLAGATDIANRVPAFRFREKLGAIFDYLSWMMHPRYKVSSPPMHNSIGNRPRAVVSRAAPEKIVLSNPVKTRHGGAKTFEISV